MEYVIGGIAVLICIFLAGFFMKKKYYKETDRLEAWKMDITNRPVLNEMQKVKRLNMNGETEERFERWRGTWDEIVTTELPRIEELLFDIEESIDKYRFKQVKQIQAEVNTKLSTIEDTIKTLLNELGELVGSEEKNRAEIDGLKETYRECKKRLLAHRYLYGKMEKPLEEKLENISKLFQGFDENTNHGNYLAAREIVIHIHELLTKTKREMDSIPNLLNECQSIIPAMLVELNEGYREMLAQGYVLDHILIEEEKDRISQELQLVMTQFEEMDMDEVQVSVEQWKQSIEQLYDLLEKEVLAKHEMKKHDREILEKLQMAKNVNRELNDEFIQVQLSYHLNDSYMDIIEKLAKRLDQLFTRFDLIENKMNDNVAAYSYLQLELTSVRDSLDAIVAEQAEFAEKMQTLRKDEIEAREKVALLRKQIAETIRLISNSNIPGVPQDFQYMMEEAQDSIKQVIGKLNETPLNIPDVKEFLEVAILTVENLTNKTNNLFETVAITEKVIQYGNRYRSRHTSVNQGLKEAEKSFRSFQYQEALEQAVAAIEQIEPDVLKKIENQLDEELVEV
ncbi:septation ring formation regulator EzrA [Niallia sp. XMNu-256]|uniref:septation ring formation regulator EzrA n=1 Tax=Niallia sp. XMNu-256 TaxID=3082444 RepID=UPI0030CE0427